MNESNFYKRFFRLAIANIISNLMVPLAGLVDIAFLGHLAEIKHLAGVALAAIIFNYIYWTFGFLRMGTTGTTAQASGQDDTNTMLLILLRNCAIAATIGTVLLICQYPIREIAFAILNAEPEVKTSGILYYNSRILAAPAALINYVLIGWFLGREKGGKVLLLSAVVNSANVVLDYLFIVNWELESAGAGIATAASQYLMLLVGIVLVLQEGWLTKVSAVAGSILDKKALTATFELNFNITIRNFILISSFAIFNNLSSALGTLTLAANTLLLQVISFAAYFIDGLAFATESFAGNFLGQEKKEELIPLLRLAGGIGFSLGLIFALMFIVFRESLFSLLTNHQNVIELIDVYVIWLLPVLAFGSIAYILDGYFFGLTEGGILRDGAIIALVVGFLPMAAVAIYGKNTHLLWLAFTLFTAGRMLTLAWKVPETLRDNDRLITKN
ncbi:MAG: guanitoxin biosynthesis MATE family efflux transporter GntT [Cyanobacteriota bacterium]|nr:guanitoxin biosynthesis MATE family efflux transporter GntT [Cyanobacteriota bacterium]